VPAAFSAVYAQSELFSFCLCLDDVTGAGSNTLHLVFHCENPLFVIDLKGLCSGSDESIKVAGGSHCAKFRKGSKTQELGAAITSLENLLCRKILPFSKVHGEESYSPLSRLALMSFFLFTNREASAGDERQKKCFFFSSHRPN
jgi:hypothetical protein